MSMRKIAQFLKVNGALDGGHNQQRWFSVPEKNHAVRYQLWQGDTASSELYTVRSANRARNGLMSRFMM